MKPIEWFQMQYNTFFVVVRFRPSKSILNEHLMNAKKRLPNLRRLEIDYKLSIVYACMTFRFPNHPDSSPRAKKMVQDPGKGSDQQ